MLRRLAMIATMVASSCGAFPQTPINGSGFDPTPVMIPLSSAGRRRPMNNMDLLRIRDLHGVQISPDGINIAFVVGQAILETNSYQSGMFVVSTSGDSKPISLGTAGGPHFDEINQWGDDPPIWSPDSRHFYYRMNISGTWQVWMWTMGENVPVQVTHTGHDVKSFTLSPSGRGLVLSVDQSTWSASERREISEHGVLYDDNIRPWLSRPFLEELAEVQQKDPETWIHNLSSGVAHKATGDELKTLGPWDSDLPEKQFASRRSIEGHRILSSRLSPNGQRVAFIEYFDDPAKGPTDSRELFSKPVSGGTPTALTPGAVVYDSYRWSADSKWIYFAETPRNGHSHKLMVVSADGGDAHEVVRATEGDWLESFSPDNNVKLVACTRETNDTPAQLAVINVSTGALRVVVDLNPEFHDFQLGKSWRLEVTNKYGYIFHGHVVLPLNYEQGKHYPLVIVTYVDGDFFLRGGVGDEYPIQVFAANGFVVLQFDAGRDRNFKNGDFDTAILQWQSPIEGMKTAVEKLAAMGIVDPKRVGITGLSHGSEFVSYAISHPPAQRAALASAFPRCPPYHSSQTTKMVRGWLEHWGLDGLPQGKSGRRWQRISTILNADHIVAPQLINVADTEYLSGLAHMASMQALAKPIEVFVYPNESHVKNQPKHRYEIYQRNVDWLNFWLRDEEDSDPAKKAQYDRWHQLREIGTKRRSRSKLMKAQEKSLSWSP